MLLIILLATALIGFFSVFKTFKPQASYSNGMLFAVTLPPHAMDHPDIRRVQMSFNRAFNRTFVGLAAGFLPILLLSSWLSFQILYYVLWLFVGLVSMLIPFRRAFHETLALKRENEWFVGARREVHSDTRVAQLKNRRMAPLSLFAIPLAMSLLLIGWVWREEADFILLSIGGLIFTLVFLLISIQTRKSRAKTYSMNSDVNVALNQANRRALSYLWLILAIIENVFFVLLYLMISDLDAGLTGFWVTVLILFNLIPVSSIYYVYQRNRRREQDVLAHDGQVIYSDDDEFWSNGITYHNPNDTRLMVDKRVGVGQTVNTGTLAGKIIMGGVAGLTAIVIIGVGFMLVRSELTSPVLTVTPESRIEIDYPMYSISFGKSDIVDLTLMDEVPSGTRTNGEATNKYARGHFKLQEVGKTRLYIFKNNPPYIRIQLDDVYIFYNEEDPEQTRRVYEELSIIR